ncbi:MAG: leucine-rich repeat domain-containing protein [Prevotella sp.]|nr:leucine-rich repeat domain-containing protein [Prevotella sp.]
MSGCSGLKAITIGNSVTAIGDKAFYKCSGLTAITIPNSVTSIGEWAFYNCNGLTEITIGNSVTDIREYAFCFTNRKGGVVEITSLIEEPKGIDQSVFSDDLYKNASLYVPKGTMEKYKACTGWKNFIWMEEGTGSGTGEGTNPTTETCATPTISYSKGKLTFNCETEGATCHSSITDTDITSYNTNEVELGVTYNISVYAAKAGWYNSETVTATLCWIDQEPKTEGMETGMTQVAAKAVLIQSKGGTIHVQGAEDGTPISIYGINGSQAGSAISQYGTASINTSLQSGSIAIVKVGQKSVKVLVK